MLQSHHGRILITGWCGQGLFLGVTVRRSTPWWEGGIWRRERRAVGKRGGSSVVENYTTGINHFYTTVFLSPSISRFPHLPHAPSSPLSVPRSPSWPCISLLVFNPTAPHPVSPPGFVPFILSFGSWPCAFIWNTTGHPHQLLHSPSISTSFPLRFVYMLSLLICSFLLPSRDLSPCPRDCISEP